MGGEGGGEVGGGAGVEEMNVCGGLGWAECVLIVDWSRGGG